MCFVLPFEYHHRILPFHVSHKTGYRIFWRYRQQQMDMIRHHLPFYDRYSVPLAQIPDDVSDILTHPPIVYEVYQMRPLARLCLEHAGQKKDFDL